MFKSGASSSWLVVQPVTTHKWHYLVASGMWHVHAALNCFADHNKPTLNVVCKTVLKRWRFLYFLSFQLPECFSVFSFFSKVCISSRLHASILDLNIVLLTFTLIPQRMCWKVVQVILFFLKLSPVGLNRPRNKRPGLLWVFCLLHFKISSFFNGQV